MSELLSRRDALVLLAVTCGVGAAAGRSSPAQAADLPHLSPTDPTAAALSYHEDAKKVTAKEFPTFQPGQTCSSCQQLQGTAGQAWRPCTIFAGKLVNANGWCKVWVKKA